MLDLITARLGVPPEAIVSEYGMSELSSQAYSLITNHSALPFRFPPWCRAQVISPETGREVADGETGLLRIRPRERPLRAGNSNRGSRRAPQRWLRVARPLHAVGGARLLADGPMKPSEPTNAQERGRPRPQPPNDERTTRADVGVRAPA